jgi:HK97 gp10 family phage protein
MARSRGVSFKFEGGKEIQAALGQIATKAVARKTARRALEKAGEPIRGEWERGVDVDSGDLKKAIKVGKANRKDDRFGNKGDRVTAFVGVDLSINKRLSTYARIEEFGGHGEVANPAGRHAFETKKQEAVDRLGADLWNEIDATTQRASRKAARSAAKG